MRKPDQSSVFATIQHKVSESGLAIFHYLRDACRATPQFIGAQLSHPKAPKIFSQTALLFFYDIFWIMLVHCVYAVMTQSAEKNSEQSPSLSSKDHAMAAQLGFYFIAGVSTLLIFRQKMQFLVHSTLLSIAYPKAFDEATQSTRIKCDASVCGQCSSSRFIKGEIRTVIVYFAQLMTLNALQCLPYVGSMTAFFSQLLLTGQLMIEYRLANDGVCDRHRGEYTHQYLELPFALGFMHYVAAYVLASQVEWIPGLKRSDFDGVIRSVLMLYFVGLVHHMHFPKPVAKATRHFYDALMLTRFLVSSGIDLITPGLKKIFNTLAEEKKEKLSWKNCRHQINYFFQKKYVRQLLALFLPAICRDYRSFQKDPIIVCYWPSVFKKLVEFLDNVMLLRKPALGFASIMEFYQQYVVPAQEVVGVIGFLTPMLTIPILPLRVVAASGVFQLLSKPIAAISNMTRFQQNANQATAVASQHHSVKDLMQSLSGMPRGAATLLVALMRDHDFMCDVKSLREFLHQSAVAQFAEVNANGFERVESPNKKLPSEFDLVRTEEAVLPVKDDCRWVSVGSTGSTDDEFDHMEEVKTQSSFVRPL